MTAKWPWVFKPICRKVSEVGLVAFLTLLQAQRACLHFFHFPFLEFLALFMTISAFVSPFHFLFTFVAIYVNIRPKNNNNCIGCCITVRCSNE